MNTEKMNYLLHIETSTKVCSVAISLDGKLIALKESNDLEYSHGENLTLFIAAVLEEASLNLQNLTAISVASGPGSYTGLRIGVSTAKGLCYALGIPLIAVDALYSLAQIASDKHPDINLCPVIDARRMEVFNAIFTNSLETLKVISADVIDEHSYLEFEPFVYFGDGATYEACGTRKLIENLTQENIAVCYVLTYDKTKDDMLLIDYSKEDGIQFVKDVKDLLESTGYMTKMKRGVSYDFE
jgi:tRNA threonylcarbamoyladenosine biosynthesis protein TsaB